MKITKAEIREAKKLTTEVWRVLHETGVKKKKFLPEKLYLKIQNLNCECPLCEIFCWCDGCPLRSISCCPVVGSYFHNWEKAKTKKTRKKYAALIYEAIANWKI